MKFGPVATAESAGLILAHSAGGFKKGRKLSSEDIALLGERGVTQVMAVRLDPDDIPEDDAARLVSLAAVGALCEVQAPFTGRANVHSDADGLLIVDQSRLAAFNRIHESLTLATLRGFERVAAGQMVATIKIIPFAVPKVALDQALDLLKDGPLMHVAAFVPKKVGLVITKTASLKASLVEKSQKAVADRLASLGSALGPVSICAHDYLMLAKDIKRMGEMDISLILLFGAAAIVDRADVIPAGLIEAGGVVRHLGMPVDPGNLLMLGQLEKLPVIGVPTCARSPKVNGFDWVLQRLCAELDVTPSDIMAMGAGGLLAEIVSRPLPRSGQTAAAVKPRVAAIVLAAGLSSRMVAEGMGNKLLAELHGRPLIAETVDRIRASKVDEIFVVTGHEAEEVASALAGQDVTIVHNTAFAEGLSTSVRAGVAAAREFDAVFICLGDMPLVSPEDLRRMTAAFSPPDGRILVAPVHGHKLGNPVLWGRDYFGALMALSGDRGARGLLESHRQDIIEIPIDHEGVILDADTPEALARIRSVVGN